MVKLADQDIQTREVLDWKGLHVFHFPMSSCSAKLRIFLNLKHATWHSHIVDLAQGMNISEWFLGINPRGLVPVIVHDGDVHIESNDILVYLDESLGGPKLVPPASRGEIKTLLRHEDDLHLSLRTLSLRFVFDPPAPPKTQEMLDRYSLYGSGLVNGSPDPNKAAEIEFWKHYSTAGVSDGAVRDAVNRFREAFVRVESQLDDKPYLLGSQITVLDIAWFIYVDRLTLAGYPIQKLHPRLATWFDQFSGLQAFTAEVALAPELRVSLQATRRRQAAERNTLADVAGLA